MKKLFPPYILLPLLLLACQTQEEPAAKLPDYKPSEDDIVSMHGDIQNMDRFSSFIDHVQQGSKDTIRVVSYTEEGARSFMILNILGKSFILFLIHEEMVLDRG